MTNYIKKILGIFFLFSSAGFASSPFSESFMDLGDTCVVQRHYSKVPSTQDEIDKHLKDVSPSQWVMVSADKQDGGKGLWGRPWVSPEGNVFVTYALFTDPRRAKYMPIISALAIMRTLEEYGLKPKLRWVNNVLVDHKKIGGILCEGAFQFPYFQAKIGIGINVNMTKGVCDSIDQPVTSLSCLLGSDKSSEEVINKLTQHLYTFISSAQNDAWLIPAYGKYLAYAGEKVQIFDGKEYYEGTFKGVNDFGHLILQTASSEQIFSSGEIVPRK